MVRLFRFQILKYINLFKIVFGSERVKENIHIFCRQTNRNAVNLEIAKYLGGVLKKIVKDNFHSYRRKWCGTVSEFYM